VRAPSDAEALQRLCASMSRYCVTVDDIARVKVVAGDIEHSVRVDFDVCAVVHCAARVNW
jgi:thioester reductase-like protein